MAEIPTPNGRIRELEDEDIPIITEMSYEPEIRRFYFSNELDRSDSAIARYWNDKLEDQKRQRALEAAKIKVKRQLYSLAIEEGHIVRGVLSFAALVNYHIFELSYFVGKDFRRQGIAARALSAAVPFAFNELEAETVQASCSKENTASQNLLKKIGLMEKGSMICANEASRREEVYYGLRYREFLARNQVRYC